MSQRANTLQPKPATMLPNIIKCLKHDSKHEEESNLEDFVQEIYETVERPLTCNQDEDEGTAGTTQATWTTG